MPSHAPELMGYLCSLCLLCDLCWLWTLRAPPKESGDWSESPTRRVRAGSVTGGTGGARALAVSDFPRE